MNKSNKIFLFLLAAIYFTHAYGRMVHLSSVHLRINANVTQKASEETNSGSKKLLIHNRSHLPLTKKLEIEKLYAALSSKHNSTTAIEESVILILVSNGFRNSPFIDSPSNKAPPFFC